ILPPRPLSGPTSEATQTVRSHLVDFSAFEIEIGEVVVFPVSDVVYLSVKHGGKDLQQMHQALNTGPLKYEAQYPYHPHVTLAQNLTHGQSVEFAAIARRRWLAYTGPRK